MFIAEDYIVVLGIHFSTNCAKLNYIFKQKKDAHYLKPCIDLVGSTSNFNEGLQFNSTKDFIWRYATNKEALEYEKRNGPYDVTTLINVSKKDNYRYLIPIIKQINKICLKEKREELQVE